MEGFVALLRGINVGRGNRVPMAELRRILIELGCTDVATLLNSGNAVFCAVGEPAQLAARISVALAQQLAVSVPVVVKAATEFSAALKGNPIKGAPDPSKLLLAFAAGPEPLSELSALEPLLAQGEQFHVGPHAAYLVCPAGITASKAGSAILGKLGRGVTTRNLATCLKIAAALSSLPPNNSFKPTPLRGAA
ncbi:DUF1697 domain-containing protein [Lysobacter xanthus]